MATVINTPGTTRDDGAAAGWAVAAVVLLAVVLLALFVWPGFIRPAATPAPAAPGANINVTLPGTGGSQGETGGEAPGGAQNPAPPAQ